MTKAIPTRPAGPTLGSNIPPGGVFDDDDDGVKETAPAEAPVVTVPKRARIILEENEDIPPTGLYVGYNGNSYVIRPGLEVSVPVGVLGILEDARTLHPTRDPSTLRYMGAKPRPRFPFQVLFDPRPDRGRRAS